MKFWGLIVAFLYVIILAVLYGPLFAVLTYSPHSSTTLWQDITTYFTRFDVRECWWFFTVALIAQGALLSVPVNAAEKRPVTKRTIVPLVLATAFMTALLAVGAVMALCEVINKDWTALDQWMLVLLLGVSIWGFWALVFFRWSKKVEPLKFVEQQCRWLYRGSILELLIAVPSHIYVRQRTDCCAGILTSIGIACGVAVMLFSFGPGVFFLFKERLERLKKTIT